MPTPFFHLSLAEELTEHNQLPISLERLLQRHRLAFLFGNTAPDVQVISGQARHKTHFFSVPILPNKVQPWKKLLSTHHSLAHPEKMPAEQAAFTAGFICHLQADWIWVMEIFIPYFGLDCDWKTFKQRLYLHNVLRSYLDRQIIGDLDPELGQKLEQIKPDNWLPFVEDNYLVEWHKYLAEQLKPGAVIKTVEVFADRQGMKPSEFKRILASETNMENEIFSHVSRQVLSDYRQQIIQENLNLLGLYFNSA